MFSMIVINDAGEEVDDETAIWWLHHNFSKKGIAWVCVGGKMSPEARLNRLKSLLPGLRYTYTLESFANICKNWNVLEKHVKILQIGPITKEYIAHVYDIIERAESFEYILQGKLGETTNSKGDACFAAEEFTQHAKSTIYVDGPYPKYTYSNASKFSNKIKNEIIKIAFINTVGRAPPLPFTVHLVGIGGANYETAASFYQSITNKKLYNIRPSFNSITLAKLYVDAVDYNHPFVIQKMKNMKQTQKDHIDGLAKMLEAFSVIFGLNVLAYSDEIKLDDPIYAQAYNKFCYLLQNNKHIELTPAYDLKAAYVAMYGNVDEITVDEILKHNENPPTYLCLVLGLLFTYTLIYSYIMFYAMFA